MPRLIAAYVWLDSHRGLAAVPARDQRARRRHQVRRAAPIGTWPPCSGFRRQPRDSLPALAFGRKPGLVRLRPAPSLGLPAPLTELAVRSEELAQLTVEPRVAVIVENEITYLSVDIPEDGVVIWGKGFEVDSVGQVAMAGRRRRPVLGRHRHPRIRHPRPSAGMAAHDSVGADGP